MCSCQPIAELAVGPMTKYLQLLQDKLAHGPQLFMHMLPSPYHCLAFSLAMQSKAYVDGITDIQLNQLITSKPGGFSNQL
jgi:hypothetical protein